MFSRHVPRSVSLVGSLLIAIAAGGCAPSKVLVRSAPAEAPLLFTLPPALEKERIAYENDVSSALLEVSSCFTTVGVSVPSTRIIDSVIVFESAQRAREYLAAKYQTKVENIPTTFAGTVDGSTLFLVSQQAYKNIWQAMYPTWPWTDTTYHQLVVHELAHRAHEAVALAQYGSADSMGPAWFFEGFAVTCAKQFDAPSQLLTRTEIKEQLGKGLTPKVSYPLYGLLVRSLAAECPMKMLLERASDPAFPEILWRNSGAKDE